MNHDLIRQWLDLQAVNWPPDHYTLLALPLKETEAALIERRVHERMMAVRPYQLHHPEEATEVLNRLAAAFNCLTDPAAKQSYDASLGATTTLPISPWRGQIEEVDPADPLAWLFGPWSRLTAHQARNGPEVAIGPAVDATSSRPDLGGTECEQPPVLTGTENPATFKAEKIWSWLWQCPGILLLTLGMLAFLVALIRRWSR